MLQDDRILEYRLNNIPLESTSNILIILLDITGTYEFMNAILTLNSILINPNKCVCTTTEYCMSFACNTYSACYIAPIHSGIDAKIKYNLL